MSYPPSRKSSSHILSWERPFYNPLRHLFLTFFMLRRKCICFLKNHPKNHSKTTRKSKGCHSSIIPVAHSHPFQFAPEISRTAFIIGKSLESAYFQVISCRFKRFLGFLRTPPAELTVSHNAPNQYFILRRISYRPPGLKFCVFPCLRGRRSSAGHPVEIRPCPHPGTFREHIGS